MRLSQFNQSNTNTNPMATQPYSQPYSQTNPQAYQAYWLLKILAFYL